MKTEEEAKRRTTWKTTYENCFTLFVSQQQIDDLASGNTECNKSTPRRFAMNAHESTKCSAR